MSQADVMNPDNQATKAPLSPMVVGLAIVFFFPVGLYLLWRHPVLGRNKAWWWAGGIWSFLVLVSATNGDKDKKPGASEVVQTTPARPIQADEKPRRSQPAATTDEEEAPEEPPARNQTPKPKKVKKGINLANYEQIADGMTREEVEAMLGKGSELASAGDEKAILYESSNVITGSHRSIEIHYLDGRVTVKFKDGF